jgi:hypothetical protein
MNLATSLLSAISNPRSCEIESDSKTMTIDHGVILKGTLLGQAKRPRSLRHKHPLANQTPGTTGDSTRLPITIPRKSESSIRTSSSPTPSISAAPRLSREASREQVQGFVAHLADWAEKDRNALLRQLNRYLGSKEGLA